MKIRIKYTKTGVLKYIGHLDMMRYFQKLLRRSGMDIGFTQGYSPHPEISIALPLGIGVTSEAEYMDVTVNSCGHSAEMIELLNKDQVEGVRVLSFRQVPDGRRSNCMAIVSAARYQATFSDSMKAEISSRKLVIEERLQDMLAQSSIIIRKKTKRSDGDADIRPLVYEAQSVASLSSIELLLAAGSANSLNPDTFMRDFAEHCGIEPQGIPWHIHRLEIYAGEKDALVPLDSLGEDV